MSLPDEIELATAERGVLPKEDTRRLRVPSDDEYCDVQDRFDNVEVFEPGRKGTGGYAATYAKGPKQPQESLPEPTVEHDWQNRGFEAHVERFLRVELLEREA